MFQSVGASQDFIDRLHKVHGTLPDYIREFVVKRGVRMEAEDRQRQAVGQAGMNAAAYFTASQNSIRFVESSFKGRDDSALRMAMLHEIGHAVDWNLGSGKDWRSSGKDYQATHSAEKPGFMQGIKGVLNEDWYKYFGSKVESYAQTFAQQSGGSNEVPYLGQYFKQTGKLVGKDLKKIQQQFSYNYSSRAQHGPNRQLLGKWSKGQQANAWDYGPSRDDMRHDAWDYGPDRGDMDAWNFGPSRGDMPPEEMSHPTNDELTQGRGRQRRGGIYQLARGAYQLWKAGKGKGINPYRIRNLVRGAGNLYKGFSTLSQGAGGFGNIGSGIGSLFGGGAGGGGAGGAAGAAGGGFLGGIGVATTALAGFTAGVLIGVAAFTALVVGVNRFAEAVSTSAKAQLESQRHLAKFSGAMAAVFAQFDAEQMVRDMRMGNALAPSAGFLGRRTSELENSLQSSRILMSGVGNIWEGSKAWLATAMNNIVARPIASAINDLLGWNENAGQNMPFVDWMNNVAGKPVAFRPVQQPEQEWSRNAGAFIGGFTIGPAWMAGKWVKQQLGF